ncbi:MAG: hypothetical protein ABL998_04455 [Planctomycetota bacterium]
MQRSSLLATLALTSGCHVRPESLLPSDVAHATQRSEHLTGARSSFVVLGDMRSFVWPTLLQEMLDRHAGRQATYHVLNASTPAAGVAAWTEASSDGPLARLEREVLAGQDGAGPTTALCLVSLGGIGDERGPVKSEHDMVGAEMGANALERLALELRQAGIERVVFATPVFTENGGSELSLEHVAIERVLARGHSFIEAGPDLFRASKRYYPDAYLEGGEEPNEFGQKLLAEEWYRWLAGPEAREEVVQELYATAFDVDGLREAFRHEHHLPTP